MQIRGVIQTAELQEHPPGGDEVEMLLVVQGVKPGQPRRLVIPFEFMLREQELEPEAVAGRGFLAEIEQDGESRWVVSELSLAGRVLRSDA